MYPTSEKTELARKLQQTKKQELLDTKRHQEQLLKLSQVERSFVSALQQLVRFLDGKTTKTEVINQLKSISTPDVDKVVKAVEGLDKTVIDSRIDLAPLEKVMQDILKEQKTHLKEIKFPEQKESVKVSNLKEIDFKPFVKAIKELKFEAPKVDVKVPETKINVEKPDLQPLQSSLLKLITTVERLKFPKIPATDLTVLEDEAKDTNKKLDEANKNLKKLVEKPVYGGGGGGTGTSFKNPSGNLTYVEVGQDGSVPTNSPALATQIKKDSGDTNILYIGKAPIGSATSSAVWQIARLDTTSGELVKTWADGNSSFDNVYSDRESLTYN